MFESQLTPVWVSCFHGLYERSVACLTVPSLIQIGTVSNYSYKSRIYLKKKKSLNQLHDACTIEQLLSDEYIIISVVVVTNNKFKWFKRQKIV